MSTTSSKLLAAHTAEWRTITVHPFVAAVFDRGVVADHHFVVGFRRLLGRLAELAPDEPARDLLT